MPPYIAFLDLVGMRDLATHQAGAVAFQRVLSTYHKHVCGSIFELGATRAHVHFFSDSAFIESSQLDPLLRFLCRLRMMLMAEGVYFKAAVTEGALGATMAWEVAGMPEEDHAKLREVVSGSFFGSAAARAYSLQERLKGIGVYLDFGGNSRASKSPAAVGRLSVQSCYLGSGNGRTAIAFRDIALDAESRAPRKFAEVIHNLLLASSRSRRFARYYVSLLVSWANSAPVTESTDKGQLLADPVHDWTVSGRIGRLSSTVIGLEQVFYAIVNRIFAKSKLESIGGELLGVLRRRLASQRRYRPHIAFVPTEILSDDSREEYTRAIAAEYARE